MPRGERVTTASHGEARGPGAGPVLLGVRHHGPGSARAVRAALDACRPCAVLIEGPPEADPLIGLAAEDGMRPPVALLAHAADDPGRAAFWPLAEFSPEWVAIRWALAHGVPVRFIDLPAAVSLALAERTDAEGAEQAERGEGAGSGEGAERGGGARGDGAKRGGGGRGDEGAGRPEPSADGAETGALGPRTRTPGPGAAAAPPPDASADAAAADPRVDPLAVLAQAAGYDDPERWWEDVVEHRAPGPGPAVPEPLRAVGRLPGGSADGESPTPLTTAGDAPPEAAAAADGGVSRVPAAVRSALAPFEALAEAMAALRAEYGHGGQPHDAVREAHMRLRVREARREFGDGIAVVCGAWHVPALSEKATVTADRGLLKGLPKVKAELSWVPWTHRRLSRASGYGAGITSPGWYGHLFRAPDRPIERWLTDVAALLRAEDFGVSSAHVIEAVRLAETLAVMRGRPLAGLTETLDAARAVMCDGSDVPLALVRDRLVVGDVLGEVPDSAPAVPLQRDLTRTQRALRLKPEASERELELDLRKDNDAARSRLLHRLRLLGVDWGSPARSARATTGTFRETWRLCWEPELSVRVAEAGVWGTTVASAATAKAESLATGAAALAEITELAERCLLADLADALPVVMRALADRAALDADVGHLAQALPALVRSVRYGDVRGTGTAALAEVATGLAERVIVGLPPACAGLDADGAAEMRAHMEAVHQAIGLLADDGLRARWTGALRLLADRDSVPGLLRGRATRLLLDDGRLAEGEAARLMRLALSPGTEPPEAAAWIEGFAGGGAGGGMLLVHDERLLALLDDWLTSVPAGAFTDVLPLLRRTFSAYEAGVRRTLGELVRRGASSAASPGGGRPVAEPPAPGFGPGLDQDRAAAVLPTLHLLLGLADDHRHTITGAA
ncbi:DUF5682 family protein [Streptomyces sp. P1-3]|uniref:DUF5682 family protein n=1 Tax=Streptomyces sp. P1-3 TaxID=3421658 RepID=UPI003D35E2D4